MTVAPSPRSAMPNGTLAAELRADYSVICDLIRPGASVLDLGCGNGDLLLQLRERKQAQGRGLEISEEGIRACIQKGLTVAHTDVDEGLEDYGDQSFDYVILNQTLQAVRRPAEVLEEIVRVGREGIVSFPNFAYWRARMQFFFRGQMPVVDNMPYTWYNTPNIHHVTIKDFRKYCHEKKYRVLREHHINSLVLEHYKSRTFMPNLRARYGLFVITNLER